ASAEALFGSKATKDEGNKEIRSIISALGCGLQDDYDESKLRFGKVIILSDADVDGQHIANLLLSFFVTYMPDLIKNGHVYVVDAPLFIGNSAKSKQFGMTRAEVDTKMKA
ncbi:toprim domain-containing protein, partial [Pseudomonas syringae pv. tomato]|uniref:toprim domain-containing protein n=1 Tax=Pseudomonas syringae group genomosp. 3 TaxID=251701 RepID=UPI0022A752FA